MWCKVILIFSFLIETLFADSIGDKIIIALPDGQVRGQIYLTGNNKTYHGFQGIPYATPPVGDLRLEVPRPAQPWLGIRDAMQDSKICISSAYLLEPEKESEDCLYINVYVPSSKKGKRELPVMVWIYGGAFTDGSSLKSIYGPDFLIEKDVIVVSFNYRGGPLGFISTGDTALPGNLGLKDQVLALKWVRKNIRYFGGDPNKVTVFGQSAGATSIGLHLISKKSAGLFRAAILESGSALVHWSVDWDPKTKAYQIADAIPGGTYGNDSQKLKEFLKNSTVAAIATAFRLLPAGTYPAPTIEPKSKDAFVTESHYELLAKGDFNQVPILIGMCSEESLLSLFNLQNAMRVGKGYDDAPTTIIADDLRPKASDVEDVVQQIKAIYLNDNETFESNLVGLAEYFSDNRYTRGIIKHAEISSSFVPVYLYEFAYYGRVIVPAFIEGAERVGHAGELPFLFNSTLLYTSIDADLLTQNRLVTLWTNFAKYLNPTPKKIQLFSNVIWPTISQRNLKYLNINNTLEIRASIKKETYRRWNDIYETYGAKPFITF